MRLMVLFLALAMTGGCDKQNSSGSQGAAGANEAGQGVGLDRSHRGAPAPTVRFTDASGRATTLADVTDRPVLVNLWATWCGPCVKELPTLDAVAAAPGAPRVVAISQDTAPLASVAAFWDARGLTALKLYHDEQMALSGALGTQILPTSILYDSAGREVWRYVGDRDWADGEARALLAEAR